MNAKELYKIAFDAMHKSWKHYDNLPSADVLLRRAEKEAKLGHFSFTIKVHKPYDEVANSALRVKDQLLDCEFVYAVVEYLDYVAFTLSWE